MEKKKKEEVLSMIILAGGRSSRMGRDKSDLIYNQQTFLEIQIKKGRELGVEDILVSGYRGLQCSAPVIPDRLKQRGPLAGLESCLRQAKYRRCLVLSVDVPLVSTEELRGLIQKDRENSAPVTILSHNQKQEPLIGVYGTELADMMAEELEKGKGSVFAFLRKNGFREYQSQGEEGQFQNINEKADYQRLQG